MTRNNIYRGDKYDFLYEILFIYDSCYFAYA